MMLKDALKYCVNKNLKSLWNLNIPSKFNCSNEMMQTVVCYNIVLKSGSEPHTCNTIIVTIPLSAVIVITAQPWHTMYLPSCTARRGRDVVAQSSTHLKYVFFFLWFSGCWIQNISKISLASVTKIILCKSVTFNCYCNIGSISITDKTAI